MTSIIALSESFPMLARGQLWRTGAADIQILGLSDRFIHYKVTSRLGKRRVSAQVSGVEPMQNYLKLTEARLVRPRHRGRGGVTWVRRLNGFK